MSEGVLLVDKAEEQLLRGERVQEKLSSWKHSIQKGI